MIQHSLLGGLQIGGGINDQNAQGWLDAGASKVSTENNMTSYLAILKVRGAGYRDILPIPRREILAGTTRKDILRHRQKQTSG